jgi:hypothetical protein
MFRSLFRDHHQGLITVLVQFLLIGLHASSYSCLWLYVVGVSVRAMYLSVWCLAMYSTRHHTERYIVRTDTPITYSHRPEYDEACKPISRNCTSTVINP